MSSKITNISYLYHPYALIRVNLDLECDYCKLINKFTFQFTLLLDFTQPCFSCGNNISYVFPEEIYDSICKKSEVLDDLSELISNELYENDISKDLLTLTTYHVFSTYIYRSLLVL